MSKSRIKDRSSKATACLEQAWAAFQKLEPRLPSAVVVILDAKARGRKGGHFVQSAWKYRGKARSHEIAISPHLFQNPNELLACLLHEAAHAILHKDHAGGCGTDGYYHKKIFYKTCCGLGLDCKFRDGRYGWEITYWPNGTVPQRYNGILELLKNGLPWGTGQQQWRISKGKKTPKSGHLRLICNCQDQSVYVNKSVAKKGGIICTRCQSEFRPAKQQT